MLAANERAEQPVINLKTENRIDSNPIIKSKTQETKYQCVVCQTNKASLSELHWHQTYQHSTEELSLSVIGWKGLVKIVGPPSTQEKENTQRSIWSSLSKKPSQFYYLSSSILRVKENQYGNSEAPIDCSLPVVKVEQDIKSEKQIEQKIPLDSAMKEDTSMYEKWEKELNWMKEISMEDFVKGANELCHELEIYKRLAVLKKATKRKNIL